MTAPTPSGLPSHHEPEDWRVIVCDEISPVLTEHSSSRYESPPQQHTRALALVRAFLELPEAPRDSGPWQRADPGGKRTVHLQRDGH